MTQRPGHQDDGLEWIKSSYSGGSGTECVELASLRTGDVAVRDSKDPDGSRLSFSGAAWHDFLAEIRDGALGRRTS